MPNYDPNAFGTDRENVPLSMFKKGALIKGKSDGEPETLEVEDASPGDVLQVNEAGDDLVFATIEVGASALDDLTDVDVSGAATGDVLAFNGATWEAVAPSGGGYALNTHVASFTADYGEVALLTAEDVVASLPPLDSDETRSITIALGDVAEGAVSSESTSTFIHGAAETGSLSNNIALEKTQPGSRRAVTVVQDGTVWCVISDSTVIPGF